MNANLADRVTSFLTEAQGANPRPEFTSEIKDQFRWLACDLSPENLHCDGEISRAQAQVKYRKLMKEWGKLEAAVGRKVSIDEVWNWR